MMADIDLSRTTVAEECKLMHNQRLSCLSARARLRLSTGDDNGENQGTFQTLIVVWLDMTNFASVQFQLVAQRLGICACAPQQRCSDQPRVVFSRAIPAVEVFAACAALRVKLTQSAAECLNICTRCIPDT
jgi:hypothetical protein